MVASLAIGVQVGLVAGNASAHVAPIEASCEAGLTITLQEYDPSGVNLLQVWIDGAERASTTFGASSSTVFSFGDLYVSHTYRVVVSAWDDPTGVHRWSFDTGTQTIPVCAWPTTTAATTVSPVVTTATTQPTATLPATTATTATTVMAGPDTSSVTSAVVTSPPDASGVTTTVVVAQAGVTGTTPALASTVTDAPGTLPVTGRDDLELLVGMAALLAGAALVLAARRAA